MRSVSLKFSVFCLFLVGFLSAQDRSSTVPTGTPIPCNTRSFSIPFDVRSEGIADPPREVELLYSTDRGARWFSASRVPVDAKKFDFTASDDGEYWFMFRAITLSGVIRATNQSGPQLRVLVDTTPQSALPATETPAATDSPRPDSTVPTAPPATNAFRSSGNAPTSREPSVVPITPPKPPRMQIRQPSVIDEKPVPQNKNQQSPPTLFSPSGEAVSLLPPTETPERPAIDPLVAEMSRFYDEPSNIAQTPEPRLATPASRLATSAPQTVPVESNAESVPGTISGVSLADVQKQPRVIVRWDTGDESWQSAHADVLRGSSPRGPWLPIATNLPNSGEYWWFVANEDAKPFYISLRLRASSGASTADATRSPIRIDPATFNSAAVVPVPFEL